MLYKPKLSMGHCWLLFFFFPSLLTAKMCDELWGAFGNAHRECTPLLACIGRCAQCWIYKRTFRIFAATTAWSLAAHACQLTLNQSACRSVRFCVKFPETHQQTTVDLAVRQCGVDTVRRGANKQTLRLKERQSRKTHEAKRGMSGFMQWDLC